MKRKKNEEGRNQTITNIKLLNSKVNKIHYNKKLKTKIKRKTLIEKTEGTNTI